MRSIVVKDVATPDESLDVLGRRGLLQRSLAMERMDAAHRLNSRPHTLTRLRTLLACLTCIAEAVVSVEEGTHSDNIVRLSCVLREVTG